MLLSTVCYAAPRGPDSSENPRNPRHCKWRGWVKTEIIKRKRTEIKLKYFALFPNAYDNGWQLFELHTGKDAIGDSQVATLLGHDLQVLRNSGLMPLTNGDKFSDKTNAEWVFGDPDFNPNALFREVVPGEDIEMQNMGVLGDTLSPPEGYNTTRCNFLCTTKTKPGVRYA
jgi:hypothetical protein